MGEWIIPLVVITAWGVVALFIYGYSYRGPYGDGGSLSSGLSFEIDKYFVEEVAKDMSRGFARELSYERLATLLKKTQHQDARDRFIQWKNGSHG